ncbi:hypothetical protein CBL_02606 [Carabus blaptoides fortunei]
MKRFIQIQALQRVENPITNEEHASSSRNGTRVSVLQSGSTIRTPLGLDKIYVKSVNRPTTALLLACLLRLYERDNHRHNYTTLRQFGIDDKGQSSNEARKVK